MATALQPLRPDHREAELIDELTGELEVLDVLDVGCEDGTLLPSFCGRGVRVTGVDLDTAILAAALQRADAMRLPFTKSLASNATTNAVRIRCCVRPRRQ